MSDPRVEGGRLSVAPEAVYTGALVMFFSNLAMPDTDPQGRPIVLWFNGIIAVCALIWGLAETMRVRKEYPWRWARTLFYDVLILVGLLIRNSDWTRAGRTGAIRDCYGENGGGTAPVLTARR